MLITKVISKGKNGKSYTSILLRQSIRTGAKVKSRTLAILTKLPKNIIQAIQKAISQPATESLHTLADNSNDTLILRAAQSFGALWLVHQVAQALGIPKALGVTQAAELGLWQVLARVLRPGISILGMVRLAANCAAAALLRWRILFTEDHLYQNGQWLVGRQHIIERRLWSEKTSPSGDQLFLYDVTSSYLEGQFNELGDWGYCRDGKKGKKQLVVGLLTDPQGDPCSVQVYRGNRKWPNPEPRKDNPSRKPSRAPRPI